MWRASSTTQADRKAMLRLVVEAVSLSPIEVPARSTAVRVQWSSGAVTDLQVPRPAHHGSRTRPETTARLRELATAGLRNDEIAARLNAESHRTGVGREWTKWAVGWARRRQRIHLAAPDRPRREPLPDQHPDGRYSVSGAAKRFGVRVGMVRDWIAKGLVAARREDFGAHRGIWWLTIDERTAARLAEVAARTRQP